MLVSIGDFKKISLDDKSVFDKHYAKYPPNHSDNVFTTMISWKEYGNYQYTILDDNLLIMSNVNNRIQFRSPSGKRNPKLFKQALKLASDEGSDPPFGFIDLETKGWLEKNFDKLIFSPDRDYYEYVYQASDLADLPGSDYSKIRNRLNKFVKNFPYSIEKISEDNMEEIGEFLKRWCLWKDCDSDPLLENEKKAILFSMSHFFELGLSGIIVRVNDNIEAISVFEEICKDTVIIHYEKGSPDYDGIYKLINREAARIIHKDYTFINRESDMGYPGLRKAKMSYRPHHMIEVFHVNKGNIVL